MSYASIYTLASQINFAKAWRCEAIVLRQLRTCMTLFGHVLVHRPLLRERKATLEVSGRQSGASCGWHQVGRGLPLRSALFAINVDFSVGGGGIHDVKRHCSTVFFLINAPKKIYRRFGAGFGVEKLLLEQYGANFRVALCNWNTKPIARAFPITKRQNK